MSNGKLSHLSRANVRRDARGQRVARMFATSGLDDLSAAQEVETLNAEARVVDPATVLRCIKFERKHLPRGAA